MDGLTQKDALNLDAVFPTVEDFIRRQKVQDPDRQSTGKRKIVDKFARSRKFIYTPEWREAVISFAENIPIALLIQEFQRYYHTTSETKRISKGKSDQDPKPLVVKGKQKECQNFHDIPCHIWENIFLRIPLVDLISCRSVCVDWAAVYASRHFQSVYDRTDRCIFINNNNLDIWAFSIASSRWFEMKVPCNWGKFGLKTLGLKAASDGLFLVARSDFSLFVVNPLTAQLKCLPRICPHTRGLDKFVKSLIVHGTAEMQVNGGDYTIYLFGNWQISGHSFVHLARYTSTTNLWTIQIIGIFGINIPLFSRMFPSPLWSFRRDNIITCVSTNCQYFLYSCDNNNNGLPHVLVDGKFFMDKPTTMDFKYPFGEICYSNVSLPTIVPDGAGSALIMVGRRFTANESVRPLYGKLPIVRHSELGIWRFDEFDNQNPGEWIVIGTTQNDFMKHMIQSSEGTDFLVVGDEDDSIWLLLRGSKIMLQFRLSSKVWVKHDIACPGGGSVDANYHWKSIFSSLRFSANV